MKLAVAGVGYVGSVTAAGFAASGHEVALYDKKAARVRALLAGRPDIYEPGLTELVARSQGRLRAAESLAAAVRRARVLLVCVATPQSPDGSIDLRDVEAVVREAAAGRPDGPLVVALRSTVVPGTTDRLDREILGPLRAAGIRVAAAANPEFLREGRAAADFVAPDRVVIGASSDWARGALREAYAFTGAPVLEMSPASAELAKYASNALLATLISFTNEIADLAETVEEADVVDALCAVAADRRWREAEDRWDPAILSYLWPGCGYGGSCLPKDVKALIAEARRRGRELRLLQATDAVNEARAGHVAEQIVAATPTPGARVAVLGTAFKEGTADERASPGLRLAAELRRRGLSVVTYDPLVAHGADDGAPDLESALRGAAVWVLVTGAPEFAGLVALARERGVVFVDARRRFARVSGDTYVGPGVGRARGRLQAAQK